MSLNILSKSRLQQRRQQQAGPSAPGPSAPPQPTFIRPQAQAAGPLQLRFNHSSEVYLITGNNRGAGRILETFSSSYKTELNETVIISRNQISQYVVKQKVDPTKKEIQIGDIYSYGLSEYKITDMVDKLYSIDLKNVDRKITVPESDIIKIIGLKDTDNIIKLLYKVNENNYELLNLDYTQNKSYDDLLQQLSNKIRRGMWENLKANTTKIETDENFELEYILPIHYFIYKQQYLVSDININGSYGTLIGINERQGGFLIISRKTILNLKQNEIQLNPDTPFVGKVQTEDVYNGRYVSIIEQIPKHYRVYLIKLKKAIDQIYETRQVTRVINGETRQIQEINASRFIVDTDLVYMDLILTNNNYFEVSQITQDGTYTGRELNIQTAQLTPSTVDINRIKSFNIGFKIHKQPGIRLIRRLQRPEGTTETDVDLEAEETQVVEQMVEQPELQGQQLIEQELDTEELLEDREYEEPYEEEFVRELNEDEAEREEQIEEEETEPEREYEEEPDQLKATFRDVDRTMFSRPELTKEQKEYKTKITSILNLFNINQSVFDIYKVILDIGAWIKSINKMYTTILEGNVISNRDEKFIIANIVYNKLMSSDWSLYNNLNIDMYKNTLIERGFLGEADIELDTSIYLKQNMPYELDITRINMLLEENNWGEIVEIVFDNCRGLLRSIDSTEFMTITPREFEKVETVIPNDTILRKHINKILSINNIKVDASKIYTLLNETKELLLRLNGFLRNKNIPGISGNDSKYIIAVHLYVSGVFAIEEDIYVKNLINNDFIVQNDFRITTTLFLIDISGTLSSNEQKEMDDKLRSLAKIPDYTNILMIMYSNAKMLYEKIKMLSTEEQTLQLGVPMPIVRKRKLETRIVVDKSNKMSGNEYLSSRVVPEGIKFIDWSNKQLTMIDEYTNIVLKNKMNEETIKLDMIRSFVKKYIYSKKELKQLINTTDAIINNQSVNWDDPNTDIDMYDQLKNSKINYIKLLEIAKSLSKRLETGSLSKINTYITEIVEQEKERVIDMYTYIIKHFINAPIIIKEKENEIEKLRESIQMEESIEERNMLIGSFIWWNVVIKHFKYLFNEFLDLIGKEQDKMEIESVPKTKTRQELDIRSKFMPKEQAEEEEETKEIIRAKRQKQQTRIGLTKGAREYLPMLRRKEKEERKERRQQQLEDIAEFKKMRELAENESDADKYNKLIEELQSEMIREEGEALGEEIGELLL